MDFCNAQRVHQNVLEQLVAVVSLYVSRTRSTAEAGTALRTHLLLSRCHTRLTSSDTLWLAVR